MKRTSVKLKLKQRLQLVRATVRQLTPAELGTVNGGNGDPISNTCPTYCCDGVTAIP